MKLSAAAICALSWVGQSARFKSKVVTIAGVSVHNYKPDNKEWVLLFKKGTSDSSIESVCSGNCEFHGHPSERGFAFAKVQGTEQVVEKMLASAPAGVLDFIEPDEMDYMIPEILEDAPAVQAAAMKSWGLSRIGAETRPTTGKGVHIYVADTGIRSTHRDFGGRAAGALDMSIGGKSGTDCAGSKSCALDAQGHGSHCAGTAAGTEYGVAPDALVYAVKTLSDQGSGSRAWQYAGIDWVAVNGKSPKVLSMSLGGQGVDPAYDAAFEAAMEAGVTAVLAAGNSKMDTCRFSPAYSKNAITVGATDSRNKRASYSNHGKCNDIMAPGSYIKSLARRSDYSYTYLSGTSMACPHVSGAAALLLESNPTWGKNEILSELKDTAIKNYISGLVGEDPNYFLWVGSEPAVSPAPTPKPLACPAWTTSPSTDIDGNCYCTYGQKCSLTGKGDWNCPTSDGPGGLGGVGFQQSCAGCRCYSY